MCYIVVLYMVVFFKQKTAYEMRISDWSSDVCSSDLVTAWVVPGSEAVRRAAEAEGLDRVFTDAGFQWREPGCSLCVAANGDRVPRGARCVSTSNRNFVGRQGPGARTHLASPAVAAAAAIGGAIVDVGRT